MKCAQRILVLAAFCAVPWSMVVSARAEEASAREARKEWLDQVERARQRVEQIRQDGTFIEEKQPSPPNESTQQKAEQIRREGEFAEPKELAAKNTVSKDAVAKEAVAQDTGANGKKRQLRAKGGRPENAMSGIATQAGGTRIQQSKWTGGSAGAGDRAGRQSAAPGSGVQRTGAPKGSSQRTGSGGPKLARYSTTNLTTPSPDARTGNAPSSCSSWWTCLKQMLVLR